jgi:hypothetical protein
MTANPWTTGIARVVRSGWPSPSLSTGHSIRTCETEHTEVPIAHLIWRKLVDRSGLLGQLGASEHDAALGDAASDLDAVRQALPGSTRARVGLPGSRDFR